MSFAQEWSTNLTTALKTGKYASEKASWLSGADIKDATSSSMVWARDSNAYVCTAVMPGGVSAVETGDLGDAYYNGVVDVVELQIAKGMYQVLLCCVSSAHQKLTLSIAGYRLAAWLNLISSGAIGLPVSKVRRTAEPITFLAPGEFNDFSDAKLARRAFGHKC
jgi:hypothetical protein